MQLLIMHDVKVHIPQDPNSNNGNYEETECCELKSYMKEHPNLNILLKMQLSYCLSTEV